MIFKEFANIDAFPLVLNTKDVDEIVSTVKNLAPAFGGINLEDISGPRASRWRPVFGSCSTSPCSTTTSTAPPWWPWRR